MLNHSSGLNDIGDTTNYHFLSGSNYWRLTRSRIHSIDYPDALLIVKPSLKTHTRDASRRILGRRTRAVETKLLAELDRSVSG